MENKQEYKVMVNDDAMPLRTEEEELVCMMRCTNDRIEMALETCDDIKMINLLNDIKQSNLRFERILT